ncbi:MAG: nodulation protein NfeD [Dehalococcoidia bacterium]|nr:nodulation protein NfeD [Dehalococcoidia bacterium]
MRRRPARGPLALCVALAVAVLVACAPAETPDAVHVVEFDGVINAASARYVDRVLTQAEDHDARAVVIEVDTPGGEINAMKEIVGRIERSSVPVLTFVGPAGAAAASAGTFVVMAGNIAGMAPNTTIGAATPVTGTGGDIEGAMGEKVTNDTVAFARGVAELRGRNADWAERAVREAISASPSDAVEQGVVDLTAPDLDAFVAAADGREVTLLDGTVMTLDLGTAPRVSHTPNVYERVLSIFSDPVIVSLLFLLGVAGIGIEFFAPGLFLPGTVGVLALLAAFLGLGTLLPGEAAFAFILIGVALGVLEAFVPSGGILGAGAAVALVAGFAIVLGQLSTALTITGILTVAAVVLGTLVLLIGGAFVLIARGHIAGSEQSGGRLL